MNETVISGLQTAGCHYYPNAYLMSLLLFIGTFLVSTNLKEFRGQVNVASSFEVTSRVFRQTKTLTLSGVSPGLVVIGGDSCFKGRVFESQHWILDGHF